ncbi:MAG: glutathione ABC transporter permease GsiC [Gammaproteobacteria bacterium]|nr:glutathione ABC transporter permease GsiC [Gammaproteobacteria bacterium]
MLRYLFRRLIGAIFVMWVVAMLVFFMMRIVPGDPFEAMLFDTGDPAAAEELRKKFGLDQPAYIQYFTWQWNILHGEFGFSIYGSHQPVGRLIAEALPRTLSLAALSFFLAILIAVPAGIIAATRRNTGADYAVTIFAFIGLSMPEFWVAILLIIFFAANLHWLPAIGYVPLAKGFWPWFSHLILPAIAVGTGFSAIIARMIRSAMIEVLKTDYMRLAKSKGLSRQVLTMYHAFPNALIPVVTVVGIAFALLMAGAVVVENVFAIKGLGRLLIQGILNRDYPLVQGTILVVSGIFVFSNLLVDLLYTIIDPRIRYEK